MINFDDIKKINIELHSFCNLYCKFCLNSLRSTSKHNIDMNNDTILKTLNLIKKCKNIEMICLSGHNQPIRNKLDIKKLNEIIGKIKTIKSNVVIKICSNTSFTKSLKFEDIFNIKYDILYLTRYRKSDISIYDIIKLCGKYTLFYNKTDNTFLLKLGNKTILYKDWSIFEKVSKINTIKEYKHLQNMGGNFNFLPKCYNKHVECSRNELFVNYNGNITRCCNVHSDIFNKLTLGNVHNLSNLKNVSYDNNWCKQCDSVKTYDNLFLNFDDYVQLC